MVFEGLSSNQLQIKFGGSDEHARAVAPTGLMLPPLVDMLVAEMDGTRTIGGVIDAVMLQLAEALAAGDIVDSGAQVRFLLPSSFYVYYPLLPP